MSCMSLIWGLKKAFKIDHRESIALVSVFTFFEIYFKYCFKL